MIKYDVKVYVNHVIEPKVYHWSRSINDLLWLESMGWGILNFEFELDLP